MNVVTICQNTSLSSISSSTGAAIAAAASADRRCCHLPFSNLGRRSYGNAALVMLVQPAVLP
jgi:hypothetical protein